MQQKQSERTPLLNVLSITGLIGLPMAVAVLIFGVIKFGPVFAQIGQELPAMTALITRRSVWWCLSIIAALNVAAMIAISCLRKEKLLLLLSVISTVLAVAILLSTFVALALPMRMLTLKTSRNPMLQSTPAFRR